MESFYDGSMPDIHESLGAGPPAGTVHVTLFVPSVDRHGNPIDQDYWVQRSLETFGSLFRGATAFPPGKGVWRDDEQDESLVFDDTQMITSYVPPATLAKPEVLVSLREFLHLLGRKTNQGEIGVVIGGEYYGITEFDHEEDYQ